MLSIDWLIDWLTLPLGTQTWLLAIDWLIDWLNLALGDTNVDTVHRLIDWLCPWGHGIRSSVDWNDASALFYARQSEQTVKPEKEDSVFFTPNIPKTGHMYPSRAQHLMENCASTRGGTRAKFSCSLPIWTTFYVRKCWFLRHTRAINAAEKSKL